MDVMTVARAFLLLLVLLNFRTDFHHFLGSRYHERLSNVTEYPYIDDKAILITDTACLLSFNINALHYQLRHLVHRPRKKAYLATRTVYYSATAATFQLNRLALCGDINPNPGPCLNSNYKQRVGTSRSPSTLRSRDNNNPTNVTFNPAYSPKTLSRLPLSLCLINVRSIKSKSAGFLELVSHYNADLFALTETWLTADDTPAKLEIFPSGYKLMNYPRIGRRGGGVALLHKDSTSVAAIKHSDNNSLSSAFEFSELLVKSGSFVVRLVIVYSLPYTKSFVSDFTSYLESISILSTQPILIVGDFNLHVDVEGDEEAGDFLDILESMGLEQHVTGPTHNLGHT